MRRHRSLLRVWMFGLVALLVVGCSDGGSVTREAANEQVETLGDALAEAVMLSYQASAGRIDREDGTRAVGVARAATLELADTAATLDLPAQSAAFELTELANQALSWIAQTEYERAEKLRLEQFNPIASEFIEAPLIAESSAAVPSSGGPSTSSAIAVLAAIALGGLVLAARYRKGDIPDPVVEAHRRRAERSGATAQPIERTWSEIPALFSSPEQPDSRPSEDIEVNRGTKARSMEVELRALLMTALHQVKHYGWDMSIVCPEVRILADPVKLRQAILAALGNAFLGGAERVGILVEDLDGDILLTIGRDAPPIQSDAEESADQFINQLKSALEVDELEWSLINDDDVTLTSVSVGPKIDVDNPSGTVTEPRPVS